MFLTLDLIGWLGGFMVAGGYIMVSLRRVAPDSALFQLLNVVGAAALGISCAVEGALPPACLNAIWFVFGVRSLVAERTRRRPKACAPAAFSAWTGLRPPRADTQR